MHEMSLAEGVLQVIEEAAVRQEFTRVTTVWLEIGQLASVDVEAMRFCFDAITRNSVAQEARLEIIHQPGIGWCKRCQRSVAMNSLFDPCTHCGGHSLQVTAGTNMRIKELEVV